MKHKKFAVVLAGCGVYDGSEIHEAVCVLLAIDKIGCEYECFAPDVNQYHVINHLTGKVEKEVRNVLVESARIARGEVKKLKSFDPKDFDAIVFPGGFGVAKNLCTFAIDGADCLVNPETEKAIVKAHKAGIPIGALCISPVLIAKVVGNATLTIGNDIDTATAIENMGSIHQNTSGSEIIIDKENKIVSSPCYMLNSPINVIAQGAENVIIALLELM
jgi:enhancing lycopene biosynthesis protein 2